MDRIWELDAQDIKKACKTFGGSDKDALVDILTARTGWQIRLIAKSYFDQYKSFMHKDLESAFIGLLGLGKSNLCRLVLLRAMELDMRDAVLLREFSSGISLDDEFLIETIMSRSNAELKAAMSQYLKTFNRDLIDMVTQKISSTQPNYKEFMLKVLECKRNEDNQPHEIKKAQKLASDLYAAAAARTIGFDPGPFVEILGNTNYVQFDSINAQYKNQALAKDIARFYFPL